MSHLENEIAEQPGIVEQLLSRESSTIAKLAQRISDFDPIFIYIAARGTSDNAARYAQYIFNIHANLPVALATPSVHTLYQTSPNLKRAFVLGISQSGKSEDVVQVLKDARAQGALTASFTNEPDSPLAQASEFHINLQTGPELSVAATKTYTAQLTAVAMLLSALTNRSVLSDDLSHLPTWMSQTLAAAQEIAGWAQRYRYMERFVTIGRGYNYCTAFEISLKIKELCYIIGEGYSEADFRHGPFALVDPGFPVFVVAPQGKTEPVMLDFLAKLGERNAETLVISNMDAALKLAHKPMRLPAAMPEWLTPIAAVLPGQTFAMRLALEKGHSLDNPRNISKVTVTR